MRNSDTTHFRLKRLLVDLVIGWFANPWYVCYSSFNPPFILPTFIRIIETVFCSQYQPKSVSGFLWQHLVQNLFFSAPVFSIDAFSRQKQNTETNHSNFLMVFHWELIRILWFIYFFYQNYHSQSINDSLIKRQRKKSVSTI